MIRYFIFFSFAVFHPLQKGARCVAMHFQVCDHESNYVQAYPPAIKLAISVCTDVHYTSKIDIKIPAQLLTEVYLM